jgi:hypothetical protein
MNESPGIYSRYDGCFGLWSSTAESTILPPSTQCEFQCSLICVKDHSLWFFIKSCNRRRQILNMSRRRTEINVVFVQSIQDQATSRLRPRESVQLQMMSSYLHHCFRVDIENRLVHICLLWGALRTTIKLFKCDGTTCPEVGNRLICDIWSKYDV